MESADLALILALDCSASVTFDEFGLMAGGCGAALRDPDVLAGLTGGPRGASVCALLLWSGQGAQAVSVDWTRIATRADLDQFAANVSDTPRLVTAGATAIGEALVACEALLATLPLTGRKVIDMVGDGRSNDGALPAPIRDRLVAAGVTINGLCVLHEEADLLDSYAREVVGGPSAFAVQCQDYDGFTAAMLRKLRREIAAASTPAPGAGASRRGETT